MGYTLKELREKRAQSVGIQKRLDHPVDDKLITSLLKKAGNLNHFSQTKEQHIKRYAGDLFMICEEIYRSLKHRGKATIVIADAMTSGTLVKNTEIFKNAARLSGLNLASKFQRKIPTNLRYLPPPEYNTNSALDKRMKTEAVLTFVK
jgi:hypothetical protein